MSGFAAIVRFDGAPIDRELARYLHRSLRFRGPDGEGSWTTGGVALVHTFLARGPGHVEHQPFVLHDRIAVIAHAGIDAETIARAYESFGDAFAEQLQGDFAIVVWDVVRRRLVCARDRFGVRPLFYAQLGGALVVTNNLPTLLDYPHFPRTLNESAVADFLLFGRNQDPARTTWAAIDRVPPAHRLVADDHAIRVDRYWSIPTPDAPIVIRERDAVDRFRELLFDSVRERTRHADRIVIAMSGGLDSTSIAAVARRVSTASISAITTVWESIPRDRDRPFATTAAHSLGIDLEVQLGDGFRPFQHWDESRLHRALEPTPEPYSAVFLDSVRRAAAKGRLLLTGQGSDAILYASHRHFFDLLTSLRWLRFLIDASSYAITRRRRPPFNLRSQLRRALSGPPPPLLEFPRWIAPEFESRLGLRERWREHHAESPPGHAFRAEAWRLVMGGGWATLFENHDPGETGQPLETASPFFDARLVELVFTLPPMPHFASKDILRQAMRGFLPDEIRLRPKRPFGGAGVEPGALDTAEWVRRVQESSELRPFVERRILCEQLQKGSTGVRNYQQLLAVSLAIWLKNNQ